LNNISKKTQAKILRLRYLDEKYNFVSYGKEDGKSVFWADVMGMPGNE
jgi:bis(5'-nucleosyl)-tetraphosphatase (symmetrical)